MSTATGSRDVNQGSDADAAPRPTALARKRVVDTSRFLLENQAINGINLPVDGGWLCT